MNRLNSVSASEHIQALYRLLLIRTGRRVRAEQALRETLTGSFQGTPTQPEPAGLRRLLSDRPEVARQRTRAP